MAEDDWADIEHARKIRAEAKEELLEVKSQASYVEQLAYNLILRRAMNHFGDDMQISFTRRGHDD